MTKGGALKHHLHLIASKADYDRKHAALTKQFGREPSAADVTWGLFVEATTRVSDFQELKWIYFKKALFLNYENRDPFDSLRLSSEMGLRFYQKIGVVDKVRILAGAASCRACRRQNDKILTVDEAIARQPVPCRGCTFKLHDDDTYSWCRCEYIAHMHRSG